MPAVNYPDLKSMFGDYSVGPTMEGYRRTQEASTNNAFNLQQAVAEEQRAADRAPIDLESLQQLARGRKLDADLKEAEQPTKLAELGRKAAASTAEDQAKDLERIGYSYQQIGAVAKANGGKLPLSLQGRVPPEILAHLEEFGPDQMVSHGDAIIKHSKSYLGQDQKAEGQMQIQQLKAEVERYKADQRRAAMKEAADARERIARQVAANRAAKGGAEKNIKTYTEAYIKYNQMASEATDPETRSYYVALANDMQEKRTAELVAMAGAKEAGKIDTGKAAGMETKPAPVAPTANPPSKTDPYAGFKIR